MQWIEIVAETVRASRERGETDQRAFAATLRAALGDRSLPPALTETLAAAAAGKWPSLEALWRELDQLVRRARTPSRGALIAVLGVAIAAAFGFVVAYGC